MLDKTITQKKDPFQVLSGNGLKAIAVISMVIDHTAVVFLENNILKSASSPNLMMWWRADWVMRYIGRLAFPIFCYLIVEGFLHTRDIKRYAKRLFLFALLSELSFDLAIFGTWFYPGRQNVFFTLLLGLLAMAGIQRCQEEKRDWEQLLVVGACCGCAGLIKSDYDVFGVFFIVLLYSSRSRVVLQTLAGAIALMWEVTAPLAFVPIRMYNGTRGRHSWKWFFYVCYPAHLALLAFLAFLLERGGVL